MRRFIIVELLNDLLSHANLVEVLHDHLREAHENLDYRIIVGTEDDPLHGLRDDELATGSAMWFARKLLNDLLEIKRHKGLSNMTYESVTILNTAAAELGQPVDAKRCGQLIDALKDALTEERHA